MLVKMPVKAAMVAHTLAPWVIHQQIRLVPFVGTLHKEPRQVQPVSLLMACSL
jgi:hypothetical protein